MRGNAVEGHLELAHVGGDLPGQELQHLARCVGDPERPCLFPQNAKAQLVGGGEDVDGETAGKTGPEPLPHAVELGRRTVAGDHHLAAMVEEGVERVEKLLPACFPCRR